MKKLHSLAFYALVAPVITLSSSALLAQQPSGQNTDRDQQGTQQDMNNRRSTTQNDKNKDRDGQYDSRTERDHQNMGEQSRTKHNEFMGSAPTSGMYASHLIGATIKSSSDDDVGSVSELVIDQNGQVVALVVGVGGFLGMGERDVAIGWDMLTKSGTSDNLELRLDATREQLRAAPEFEE